MSPQDLAGVARDYLPPKIDFFFKPFINPAILSLLLSVLNLKFFGLKLQAYSLKSLF